nr:retrotransposon protein, putative, Ty1-copia subclass [Tanacetum cinerariifolium]
MIVLSVEDKLDYLEQPIPPARVPAQAGQQVALKALAAHAAWEEGKSISSYVLKMKTDIENLESLGHLMSLNLRVSLILISLRKEFDSFVQIYNMHNMGKTVNELHAMLKLHEQTLTKKDPALMQFEQERSLEEEMSSRAAVEAIGSFHLCVPSGLVIVLKNCHYAPSITRGIISVSRLYGDGFVNCFVDDVILVSKNNMVYFSVVPKDGIFEIDLSNSNTNDSSMYAVSNKRAKLNLDSALLWHCRLGHISKKRIEKLQHDGLPNSTDVRAFEKCVSWRRNGTLLDMVRFMMSQTALLKFFWDYALDTAARILNMAKKVEKTPCKNSLITQEASGSLEDLEIIQEEDTHPSINTILHHEDDDLEIDEPQSDIIPIRRFTRTRHALDCMCLYVDAEEHELEDLGEPANYKAAMLDPEFKKWLDAMNVEMQSMKDNKVWDLVDLPPYDKTVGSKWLFKKKTDMDRAVHTFKARLVAKGFAQTYRVDYEETLSPILDIRAIRILIAIAAYYDYKIWQMDVKTVFLNGHLSEDVYMEKLEDFVNPKYPN